MYQLEKQKPNIYRCGLHVRSPKYPELGHFMLWFCRGRLRNVQKLETQVEWPLFYSLNLLFGDVFVALLLWFVVYILGYQLKAFVISLRNFLQVTSSWAAVCSSKVVVICSIRPIFKSLLYILRSRYPT